MFTSKPAVLYFFSGLSQSWPTMTSAITAPNMTVLNAGRFGGLGVGLVPIHPTLWCVRAPRNAPPGANVHNPAA